MDNLGSTHTVILMFLRLLCLCLLLTLPHPVLAENAWQSTEPLRSVAENFARQQTADLPGQVTVIAGAIDPRLRLPACPQPEAFLPTGSRLWGSATVGVRCQAPSAWTVYIPVTVKVTAQVVVAAKPMSHGHVVDQADILAKKEDITQLPAGILTDPAQAIGKTVVGSIPAGYPLRTEALRSPLAVTQGQIVKLIARGRGFSVSTEGKALANATEGQTVAVRTPSGQIVNGTARAGGVVEVPF